MKKYLLLIITLILTAAVLFGCGDKDEQTDLIIAEGGISGYKIVRSANASEAVIQSAVSLKKAIQDNFSADLELCDDWLNEKKGETPAELEILVGVSNREESRIEGLLADDYVIKAVGQKIVIVGGSDTSTVEAVKYFIENICTPTEDGRLTFVDAQHIEYKHSYSLKSLTVGGVDISQYVIVYDSISAFGRDRATALQDTIRSSYGITLDISADNDGENQYEILVGDTSRVQTKEITDSYQRPHVYYTLAVKGEKLLITFDGVRSGDAAIQWFKSFLSEQTGSLNMTAENTNYTSDIISELNGAKTEGTSLRAMTSNLLSHHYQTPTDPYQKRMEILADTYLTYLPDVIGLQECREVDFAALFPLIGEYYGVVNSAPATQNPIPGDETIEFECTKILYRKDKFRYYDAEYEKLVFEFKGQTLAQNMKTISSAVFENKTSGEKFIFVNTHFVSSYGDEKTDGHKDIRVQNATQFADKIARLRAEHEGLAIISTGDYFSPKNTVGNDYPAYDLIVATGLSDASVTAKKKMSPGMGTSHNIGTSVASTNIDLVLADTEKCDILVHRIVTNIYTKDASDHFPVYADIALKS